MYVFLHTNTHMYTYINTPIKICFAILYDYISTNLLRCKMQDRMEPFSLIRKSDWSHIECGTTEFLRRLFDVERISHTNVRFSGSKKRLRRIVTWYLIMLLMILILIYSIYIVLKFARYSFWDPIRKMCILSLLSFHILNIFVREIEIGLSRRKWIVKWKCLI